VVNVRALFDHFYPGILPGSASEPVPGYVMDLAKRNEIIAAVSTNPLRDAGDGQHGADAARVHHAGAAGRIAAQRLVLSHPRRRQRADVRERKIPGVERWRAVLTAPRLHRSASQPADRVGHFSAA
jgi:hypothetical protein